ncbi:MULTISPECIES: peptidoglycan D,D-transpeptidase FtsI family protein [Lentibacter]|jgi:cell division protein FtsI (penicillin-binding protein 3)|uniref:Cell division protein FtsI (Penicillin-binding protein 3) n=1 Tax=Lentibacter algarum TaxID=576131 RepID=A0A1H3I5F9_9RHOB|nr:penicillin-binding protein 2 [Lentibacter algarum]MCO4776269.1 penicillin-binding protein 2 [Lentibacter algarum]WIF31319.1 putative peptidoglycan synthetase [Lentibacter algarum]SDY22930.1 cell division protein FtsI (penicillin-binding protein 3) [Lentibacter algarum]
MTRIPLRPLAAILDARKKGTDPDAIERRNTSARHEVIQNELRSVGEGRLVVLGVMFFCAYAVIAAQMGLLAGSEPTEQRAAGGGVEILAQRADIVDRRGRVLATNIETHSLYAQPQEMIEPKRAAKELVRIFPDLDEARLTKDFSGKRKFIWVKKKISPEQLQQVHDIGEPGLLFGPREARLYPNGTLAAHVMGGTSFGREGVHAAEVIGTAGVEKQFDEYLRDPANGARPLQLSIDMTVQTAAERVLYGGMRLMGAKGAASILMDIHTGEVISVVSLPDFDPNNRPLPPVEGDPDDSPLFNRALQGVYELGSTFKVFTIAQAIELQLVNKSTMINTRGPLVWGKHKIRDFHDYGKELDVETVLTKSSNIGTARISQMIGAERQREFLGALGMLDTTTIEMPEASGGKPLLPKNWSEISTMTISYGHGLSATPMHLAAAFSTIANGGRKISPTLLKQDGPNYGAQVLSPFVAREMNDMLRKVVTDGTASFGDVAGYSVGGKTGTADKPKARGGYYKDKVIASFASVFPTDNPQYALIVTLDEPEIYTMGENRRSAGWTAVPVAAELINRVAPLLGLRPNVEPGKLAGITLTSN